VLAKIDPREPGSPKISTRNQIMEAAQVIASPCSLQRKETKIQGKKNGVYRTCWRKPRVTAQPGFPFPHILLARSAQDPLSRLH
jgi:hypothetical protein